MSGESSGWELWQLSIDAINPLLNAHRDASSHPLNIKIDVAVPPGKTRLLIRQRRKYVLNELLLVVFLPFKEGIQANSPPRWENSGNHYFLNRDSRSELWNHFLTPACKHRVGFNKVKDP
jgi:hypothetical protein